MRAFLWFAATVTAPLVAFNLTHRWDESPDVAWVLWWTAGAVPFLARRAFRASLLVGGLAVAGSVGIYRWVVPLPGAVDWPLFLGATAGLLVAGAAAGGVYGDREKVRPPPSRMLRYVTGAVIALLGAYLLQETVRLGAEGSVRAVTETGATGGAGLSAGRYAILATGSDPAASDCRISAEGMPARAADAMPIAPEGLGSVSYTWIATVTVPKGAYYSVRCTSSGNNRYLIGRPPRIDGLVGRMIHWPLPIVWLLGAAPGLTRIARTAMSRT